MTDSLVTSMDNAELDPSKNYLTELVGDGKKFKTHEELAYGKAQSDSYIKILERQMDQLKTDYNEARAEAASRARLEDLVNKINTSPSQPPVTEPPKSEINNDHMESLIVKKIQENETNKRHK